LHGTCFSPILGGSAGVNAVLDELPTGLHAILGEQPAGAGTC
jgi:hypothetical protein